MTSAFFLSSGILSTSLKNFKRAVSKTDGSPVEWKEIDNTGEITGSAGKHTPESVNDDFVELGG